MRIRRFLAPVLALALLLCSLPCRADYADGAYISDYARAAVALCERYHILTARPDAEGLLYSPLDPVTRQEIFRVAYLLNNGGREEISSVYSRITEASSFADKAEIADWAVPYAGYCIGNRLFVGDADNMLRPESNITYLEFALVLLRVIGYTQNLLSLAPGESVETWKARMIRLADETGLFDGVLFYMLETYDYPMIRQDAAVMLANALSHNTIAYVLMQTDGTYVDESRTLLDRSFGPCGDRTVQLTGCTGSGYLCADGTVLPSPDGLPGRPELLGQYAMCFCRADGSVLYWDGTVSPAPAA